MADRLSLVKTSKMTSATVNVMEIYVGRYNINTGLGAQHWAIKFDDTWFEIAGTSKNENNTPNIIEEHYDDSKYSTIEHIGAVRTTLDNVRQWNQKWLEEHKFYSFNGDNCQLYVKHTMYHYLGIQLDTQNKVIGGAAIGAGISATIIGICALAVGLWVKGKH